MKLIFDLLNVFNLPVWHQHNVTSTVVIRPVTLIAIILESCLCRRTICKSGGFHPQQNDQLYFVCPNLTQSKRLFGSLSM